MEAILVTANNAAFVFKLKQPKKASIEKYEYYEEQFDVMEVENESEL